MSETETTTTSPPGDDLRAVLQQSWDEAQARADADEAPREASAESTPQTDTERTRDERGRFVAREPAANGAAAETPTETTDQPEAKADEPASQAIAPPQSWSDAEKAVWGNLSREAQETVLRRERDYERGMAERATEQRSVAALREAVEPYRAMIAMEGLSEAEAVRRLLVAQEMLKRDPDRAFPELARAFNYDLRRLTSPSTQAQPQDQQFRDPRVDELLTSIQQRDQQAALSAVDAFSRDPNHPHFGDVRDHMGMLLSSGAARTLDEAYEQAVWANPAVRERMLAERARADAAQRDTEAKQRAEAARRASVSVTGRAPPGQSQGTAPAASWREEIERAWADASR